MVFNRPDRGYGFQPVGYTNKGDIFTINRSFYLRKNNNMLTGNTIITTDTSLKAIKMNVRNKIIDEILRWCVDNSIVDYEEEFSDNGDCIIVLSKLEKFLEGLKQEVKG